MKSRRARRVGSPLCVHVSRLQLGRRGTYPSGRVVAQNYDVIGRLCSVGASGSGCTTGTLYASNFGYNPAMQVTGFKYGNPVYASFGFSADRLQMTCRDYSSTNRASDE